MKRLENWHGLLSDFLLARMHQPFVWGGQDCCLFACDAILAMTGVDVATQFRGKYTDPVEAAHLLRQLDCYGIDEMAEWIAEAYDCREIPPAFAQRGDVALLRELERYSLGVVSLDGTEIIAPGPDALASVGLLRALRAWRI
jgi:hypothetical protein